MDGGMEGGTEGGREARMEGDAGSRGAASRWRGEAAEAARAAGAVGGSRYGARLRRREPLAGRAEAARAAAAVTGPG